MPDACSRAVARLATRALVIVCALALLAGTWVSSAPGVLATELASQISSGRRSQAYFESIMLAQDAAIARIKAQTKVSKRAFKHANRAVKQRKQALWAARGVVSEQARRLAEVEALHAQTPIEQIPPDYADRVKGMRQELDKATSRRVALGKALRTAIRQRQARQHRLAALKRQERGAVARRESAEGGLGAYIVEMTRLAQDRAENQSSMRLSTVAGFTWPSVGRITQTYGCTGFRLNPRRGSCAHFHDGLDIVAAYGSRVASAADGVVAYAGWNPWDEGGRAWLMVVSHPDGYVTRYGHLLPSEIVRVGEFVRQGQAIGRMGNTGRSTGTHLHFELLRSGDTVSPWTYLPEGMVTLKLAKPKRDRDTGRQRGAQRRAGRTDRPDRGGGVARALGPGRDGRVGERTIVDDTGVGGWKEPIAASQDAQRDAFELSRSAAAGTAAAPVMDVPTDRADIAAAARASEGSAPLAEPRPPVTTTDASAALRCAPEGPDGATTDAVTSEDERLGRCLLPDPGQRDWRPVRPVADRTVVGVPQTPHAMNGLAFDGVARPERGTSPVPS